MSRTWVPQACTLPTQEQPLRAAEFDALFTVSLISVERPERTRVRLVLRPDAEPGARALAARETRCCAFFTFTFGRESTAADTVWMDVAVPPSHVVVLDALAARAEAARGGTP